MRVDVFEVYEDRAYFFFLLLLPGSGAVSLDVCSSHIADDHYLIPMAGVNRRSKYELITSCASPG